jgi:hypothetical protein
LKKDSLGRWTGAGMAPAMQRGRRASRQQEQAGKGQLILRGQGWRHIGYTERSQEVWRAWIVMWLPGLQMGRCQEWILPRPGGHIVIDFGVQKTSVPACCFSSPWKQD